MLRAVIVVAALVPAAAGAAECRLPGHEEAPRGDVVVSVPPPAYRHDRSKAELSAGNPALKQGQSEAGLTTARVEFDIRPRVWSRRLPGGGACVAVAAVEVNWRIANLTVDVASDYPPGSCPYGAILDHENEHVRITRGAFDRAAGNLRRRLADALRGFARPIELAVPAGSEAQVVAQRLEAALAPTTADYQREVNRLNAAIDTPANYARVQARCRNW